MDRLNNLHADNFLPVLRADTPTGIWLELFSQASTFFVHNCCQVQIQQTNIVFSSVNAIGGHSYNMSYY